MALPEVSPLDQVHMARAVRLARAGTGATYPNPCVGAVVVSNGEVLAGARSAPTGGRHAEVRALLQAGPRARGATLYVTLEPCAHHGLTPPCVDAIVDAGIATVMMGIRDPARHVAGRGIAALRERGITVVEGVLADQCAQLHEHYLHHERTGHPFVTLKVALSQDGCIATAKGDSRWITSEAARREGHRLRALHHAIAVGVRTVATDDPALTVRMVRGTDPLPVVFDSRLETVSLVKTPGILRPGTLVLHTRSASKRSRARLAATGAEGIEVGVNEAGRVDVRAAVSILGQRKIRSLLVEGGGRLHSSFVAAEMWNRLILFQAPLFLGQGRPFLPAMAWDTVAEALAPTVESRQFLGPDLAMTFLPPADAAKR